MLHLPPSPVLWALAFFFFNWVFQSERFWLEEGSWEYKGRAELTPIRHFPWPKFPESTGPKWLLSNGIQDGFLLLKKVSKKRMNHYNL